jgi:hypothetical protein
MSIPMPGHPMIGAGNDISHTSNGGTSSNHDLEALRLLDELIATHDVIYLLTDRFKHIANIFSAPNITHFTVAKLAGYQR